MNKLLLIVAIISLSLTSCSEDDNINNDNSIAITEIQLPESDTENPFIAGSSITIKGKGFTKSSEIWFRIVTTKSTSDVKAVVTAFTDMQIIFTAPDIEGTQSIVHKQHDKEQVLGEMIFTKEIAGAIIIGKKEYPLDSKAQDLSITVSTNIEDVEIVIPSDVDWITYTVPTKGMKDKVFILEIRENGHSERVAKVTFKNTATNISETITVTQFQLNAIVIGKKAYPLESKAQDLPITVSSNVDVEVIIPSNVDWISIDPTSRALSDKVLTLKITENGHSERVAEVIFKNTETNVSDVITVTQSQLNAIVIGEKKYNLESNMQDLPITVSTNIEDVEIVIPSDVDWITYTVPTKGMKDKVFILEIRENGHSERVAKVTFKNTATNISETITVTQFQLNAIVIGKKAYPLESKAQDLPITVSSNVDVEVIIPSSVDWISVTPATKAMTDKVITLKITKNGHSERTAEVTFKNTATNVSETITVTQSQLNAIIIGEKEYLLESKAQELPITVSSNVDIEVIIPSDVDWISKAPDTKTMTDKVITLKITKNGHSERTAEVTFKNTATNVSETIVINQEKKGALDITSTQRIIGSEGLSSYSIDLQTNIEYEVIISEKDMSWISIVNSSSNRTIVSDNIYLKIEENTTNQPRSSEITIKDINSELFEKIIITQSEDAFFLLGQNPYDLPVNGAENLEVELFSITEYDIIIPNEDKSWVSLIKNTKGENSNPDRLYFNIEPNDTYSDRSVNIKIQDQYSVANVTLVFNQSQNNAMVITQKDVMVGENGGDFEIQLQANVDYEVVMPEVTWLEQVPQTRSLVSDKIKFRVTEHFAGPYNRTADIKFKIKNTDQEYSLTIIQTSSAYGIYTDRDIHDFNWELVKTKDMQSKAVLSKFGNYDEETNKWHYRLMGDVNPSYHDYWKAISEFSDIFDGNEFTITELHLSYGGDCLFSKITKGGMVKNLTIQDIYIKNSETNSNVGGICGYLDSDSEISNCTVGSFTGQAYGQLGGICSINYGLISSCTKKDLLATGFVQVLQVSGGIVATNYGVVIDCQNESNLSASQLSYQGGICGTNYGKIISSSNNGNISNDNLYIYPDNYKFYSKGGICGRSIGGSIIACVNNGDMILNCSGVGSIYVGGICGTVSENDNIIISNISTGSIVVKLTENVDGAVGGLCARITDQNYCVANYSVGILETTSYLGAITGIDRPNDFQIESNLWLENKGAEKRFGNITSTGSSDIIGRKMIGEMQKSTNELNQAKNAWNQANPNNKCEYEFYDVVGDYPKLRKK